MAGFRVRADVTSPWADMCYPGTPFQHLIVRYTDGGTDRTYDADYDSSNFDHIDEADLSEGAANVSRHIYTAGALTIGRSPS